MQVSLSCLRSFCNPTCSDEALLSQLTMGGFEVEHAVPVAAAFTHVVVAQVLSVAKHPNADRLRVCQVSTDSHGQGELRQIVCGAANVRAGLKVPCALPGAQLPGSAPDRPLVVKVERLRGVASHGMLCSAQELGVDAAGAGLWELPETAVVGQDVRSALELNDQLITLKLTPNLGHALSVYGLAREVAALTQTPLQPLPALPALVVDEDLGPGPDVVIADAQLCGRWVGRVMRNIDMHQPSPAWLVQRLARMGQRSVNILVDISNYVMLECGQPTHIFDLDQLQGALTVRWAQPHESLKLLNGQTIQLDAQSGVVADAQGPQSLAGVMGGLASAVSDSTRNIYIEAAFWWPQAVAGVARRHQIGSDAVYRFERGVDPQLPAVGVERVSALIMQHCGGAAGPLRELAPALPPNKTLALRASRVSKVLGLPLAQADCWRILQPLGALGFTLATMDADTLQLGIPSWRFDITGEDGLVGEVARLHGYDHFPNTPPLAPLAARPRRETDRSRYALTRQLVQLGYTECLHFSFVDEHWERLLAPQAQPIRLLNPMANHLGVMRTTLLGGLLQALRYNLDRQQSHVRLFECARVYERDAQARSHLQQLQGVRQDWHVAAVAVGSAHGLHWQGEKQGEHHADKHVGDFYTVRGDLETLFAHASQPALQFRPFAHPHPALHPGRSAQVLLNGEVVGLIGEVHPVVCAFFAVSHAPVVFEVALSAVLQDQLPQVQHIAKALPVERDIALLVPVDTPYGAIASALMQRDRHPLLQKVDIFDVYKLHTHATQGKHTDKSIALRLSFASTEKTLKDKEIDEMVRYCVEQLVQRAGAKWRK